MNDAESKLKHIRVVIEARSTELAPPNLACSKGCSYCCQCFPVSTHSLAEARLALQAAEASYTPRAFDSLKKEIRRQFQQTRNTRSVAEFCRLKLPCPFLLDNVCSIYDARPISCRTCVSNDKIVCMSALAPDGLALTADTEMRNYLKAIHVSREELYREMSFGDCMLELRSALVVVLDGGVAPNQVPVDTLHASDPAIKQALEQSPNVRRID